MSVLKRFRSESPFAVRDEARKLEIKIIKLCMNEKYFPKRYRFILTMDIIQDAHKLADYIEAANKLELTEVTSKRRLMYQKEALVRIEYILRKFILAEELGFTIPEASLKELGEDLVKEEKLIKNWIESDRVRLNS